MIRWEKIVRYVDQQERLIQWDKLLMLSRFFCRIPNILNFALLAYEEDRKVLVRAHTNNFPISQFINLTYSLFKAAFQVPYHSNSGIRLKRENVGRLITF